MTSKLGGRALRRPRSSVAERPSAQLSVAQGLPPRSVPVVSAELDELHIAPDERVRWQRVVQVLAQAQSLCEQAGLGR